MKNDEKVVLIYIFIILGKIVLASFVILVQITPIVVYSQKLIPYLKRNGNYIYVDSISLKPVIKQEFTKASEFQPCGNAIVIKNDKWGIINKSGIEVASCKYDIIENYIFGLARVGYKKNDTTYSTKSIIIDGQNYLTTDSTKTYITKGYRFGYIDSKGIEVIPLIYDKLLFLNNSIFACENNYRIGVIDRNNKFVQPAVYSDAQVLKSGFILIADQNRKFGLLNQDGNIIVECKYDQIDDFKNGLANVFIGEDYLTQKMGWIDSTGKEVIPVKYSVKGTRNFANEYILYNELPSELGFSSSGRYKNAGYIDRSKRQITQLNFGNFEYIKNCREGYFFVSKKSRPEVINQFGKVLSPFSNQFQIDYPDDYSEAGDKQFSRLVKILSIQEYFPITDKKLKGQYFSYGMVDIISGRIIVPPIYHHIYNYHDGIANVSYNVKDTKTHPNGIHGGVDINGKLVIPMMYDQISYFKNGLAFVRQQGKCGMINKNNKIIIPIIYEEIEEFINQNTEIYSIGTIIDKTNDTYRRILKSEPDLSFGLIKVFLKGKFGFLNTNGSVAIPTKYNFATIQNSGLILAINDNIFNGEKYFYVDKSGREYYEH
jgi:hypothetical protein